MTDAARLRVIVDADVRRAQRNLGAFNSSLSSSAKAALKATGAIAGIAGAAAGLKKIADVTVQFDRNMRNVNSIAQLSEGSFQKLSKQVRELGGQTAQSPQKLASGLYDLVSSGFDANQSLTILKSSAKAATAGLSDTATSTKAVAAVLNAYKRPASDAAKVSDDLFQTVNRGVITFEELAQNIGPVLPFAQKLGVNLKQVGAMTATLTKAGIPAAEAMTFQKGAMAALIKPSEALQGAYKKLGVSSGSELVRKTGSLQGALNALSKEVGGNEKAMGDLFPDIRGMSAAFAATGKNAKGAGADLQSFNSDAGATDKALSQQSKSIAYKWAQIKATVESTAIGIGSKLVPAAARGLDSISKTVAALKSGGSGGFSEDVRGAAFAFSGIASAAQAAAGPVVAVTASVAHMAGTLAQSRTAVSGLAGAMAGLGALKAGQIIAASAAFQNLATGISLAATAARGGELAKLPGLLAMGVTPAGMLAAAAVAAGAGIAILATRESSEARVARLFTDAKRGQVDALNALSAAQRGEVKDSIGLKQAELDLSVSRKRRNQLLRDGKKGTDEYKQAQIDVARNLTAVRDGEEQLAGSQKRRKADMVASIGGGAKVTKALGETKKQLDELKKSEASYKAAGQGPPPNLINRLKDVSAKYAELNRQAEAANRTVGMDSVNRQRERAGKAGISAATNAGADAIRLADQVRSRFGTSATQKIKLVLTGAENAKSTALAFQAILAGVSKTRVAKILAKTSGKAEVDALRNAIAGVHSVSVAVEAVGKLSGDRRAFDWGSGGRKPAKNAHGTRNFRGGMSIVGEQGPELVNLPKGSQVLTARDTRDALAAGIPGFASGTGGKKIKRRSPLTGKMESHTASEWKTIEKKAADRAKRRSDRRFERPFTAFDQSFAGQNLSVAMAESTGGKQDDIDALAARIGARDLRIRALKAQLPKLKGARRQRVTDELTNLIGSNTGDQDSIQQILEDIKTEAEKQTQALQESLQAQLDLLKQQRDESNRGFATSQAELRAAMKWIAGVASGQIGGATARSFSTPAPLQLAKV